MFVIGGRTNTVGEVVALEVYDTESSEWTQFTSLQRVRHVCWSVESTIYIHGGFEQITPNIPINMIATIEVERLFNGHPSLIRKLKNIDKKETKRSDKDHRKRAQLDTDGEKEFKLAQQAHIAMNYAEDASGEDFSMLVRQISIDKLQEEAKKIGGN